MHSDGYLSGNERPRLLLGGSKLATTPASAAEREPHVVRHPVLEVARHTTLRLLRKRRLQAQIWTTKDQRAMASDFALSAFACNAQRCHGHDPIATAMARGVAIRCVSTDPHFI